MITKKETAMRNIAQGTPKIWQWSDELLHDRELCLEAVRQSGWPLESVPAELKDREFCLEAVQQNSGALVHVPDELRDRELCLEAVRQDGKALQYVPNELRDRELCLEAVRQNGWALDDVPKEVKDREFCLEAVRQNEEAIHYVPKYIMFGAFKALSEKKKVWTVSCGGYKTAGTRVFTSEKDAKEYLRAEYEEQISEIEDTSMCYIDEEYAEPYEDGMSFDDVFVFRLEEHEINV